MPLRRHKNSFHGLSVDRISLLGSISLARVIVIQLSVPTDNTSNIPRKQSGKGRPPLPLTTRKWYDPIFKSYIVYSATNAYIYLHKLIFDYILFLAHILLNITFPYHLLLMLLGNQFLKRSRVLSPVKLWVEVSGVFFPGVFTRVK